MHANPPRGSFALLPFLLLAFLAACGGDDDAPSAVATATRTAPAAASATATAPPVDTATVPATAMPTPTSRDTSTPTAEPTPTATSESTATPTAEATATATPPSFVARGSVGQVYVIDAPPGQRIDLLDADGGAVGSTVADEQGAALFREIEPGSYLVDVAGERSDALRVSPPEETPDPSFYESQSLVAGYQYIETRDGTKLAVNVLLPGPIANGPYPTLVEYSGYDPANPSEAEPSSRVAAALGYAVVGVNMRGSGCSGGAFDFFETLQVTDGYDAVEIVAAQPWVAGHRVGMIGLSYPGISQLFVAQLRPPHLVAIAPLSVIADIARGILYPGGILNDGFAVQFAAERQRDALPGGQAWARRRMDNGDRVCVANQKLRGQSADLMKRIVDNPFYDPAVADPLSPATFVDRIDVPVFLAGAWQDEQTGGYFANMLDRFTATEKLHATVVNGNHIEPFAPAIFSRWLEFLDFYVARRKPQRSAFVPVILSVLNEATFRAPSLTLEPLRFSEVETYEEALALFEAEPRIRVLFESGAGATPGAPVPTFELHSDTWPIESVEPLALYFAEDGRLAAAPPEGEGADRFLYDPSSSQRTNYPGPFEDVWRAQVAWDWQPADAGDSVAYAGDPLAEDVVMVGPASADLWLQATAADVDLQVTLSEIRPDGAEVYVQTGWLRASHRRIDDAASSELRPVQTHLAADAAPLPSGEFSLARVEIFPFGHVFRAGSRVAVSISAPGRDRAAWKFAALPADGEVEVTIARSAAHPSRLVLPVIAGVAVPAVTVPCPGLRGQPCRPVAADESAG